MKPKIIKLKKGESPVEYYLKLCRKLLVAKKDITNYQDINRMVLEINGILKELKA